MRTLPSRRIGMSSELIVYSPTLRGEQLQRKRDLVEDDRRNRNHQQHERQRERQDAKPLPSVQEKDGARQHAEKRDA